MSNQSVFSSILGLSSHWRIVDVCRKQHKHLQITVEACSTALFACPVCNGQATIVSEQKKRWQHDNLLNLKASITAILPLTSCPQCGIHRVLAPWEKTGSRFMPQDDHNDLPRSEN